MESFINESCDLDLESSIEVVKPDDDFERSMAKSLEAGRILPPPKHERSRRRITAHVQNNDFEGIFEKANEGIALMRTSYGLMFHNWRSESEINVELEKEIKKLKSALEAQKKRTKVVMDEKSQLQEEIERLQRNPVLQEKVNELESENRALKCQIMELQRDASNKEKVLKDQKDNLNRKGEGFEDEIRFRARSNAIKRVHSTPIKPKVFMKKLIN